MKRCLITKPIKQTLLAVPAAALMLGAAQAGTTIGFNFQSYYYNSGTTPQTIGFGLGYQTTGFPVTAKAFGVEATNWYNTIPLPTDVVGTSGGGTPKGGPLPISTSFVFNSLNLNVSSANLWESDIGNLEASPATEFNGPASVLPGNDEVTWSFEDNTGWTNTLSGLNAVFPNGCVLQLIGASKCTSSSQIVLTDGASFTNSQGFDTIYLAGNANFSGPVGLLASPVLTNNAITFGSVSRSVNSGQSCALAGFIVTDQAVVTHGPASGTYVAGQSINLSVNAIGIPPLSYQWRSNGIPVSGATSTTYHISDAAVGSYLFDVIATNLYGAATSAVATVTVAVPANLTWDASRSSSGPQDGSGNWDNGLTANWWNGSTNVAWANLANARFGAGGTGAYTVTVTNSVNANSFTFNSGNYTIAGASGLTITFAGQSQITANTNATVSLPLAGTSGLTVNGSGTLTFSGQEAYAGGTIVNGGTLNLSYNNGASGTLEDGLIINSNATVVTTVNNALGYSGGSWVRNITLNYGTLNTSVATDNGWGTTINMIGGTLGATVAGGYFAMGNGPVFNVTGMSVPSVISANLTDRDNSPGGITFNVTRGTTATDLNISGNILRAGSGGITLNSGGNLQLSGVNTYTGDTVVNSGTLIVTGQLTGGGAVTLNDATALNTAANGSGAAINTIALNLGSSGASTNTLGFMSLNNTAVAPISVGGGLAVTNPVTVNIIGAPPTTGQYPLIQYSGGEIATNTFTLGVLPTGVSATIVDDHASSVYLNVTATPVKTEVWTGSPNGTWDINNTANWLIGAVASTWVEENIATFDDTASGTTAIALNTNVHPSIVIFTNLTKNYSLSGSGSIAGAASLSLIGAGIVTLNNTNTYSGGTFINGGTLSVGADSSLGTGNLNFGGGTLDITGATPFTSGKSITLNTGGGTIQVDNTAGVQFIPAITGGSALTKNGNGTLTFGGQQTYIGGTIVNGGILDLTAGGGSSGVIRGAVTINTNGILKIDTGDAFGYAGGSAVINPLYLTGGTLNINTTANQTLGSANISMTGGTITGLPGANLDFFAGSSGLNTLASSTTAIISGIQMSPLRQGSTTFDVQAGTTPNGIDLDISSVLRTSPNGDAAGGVLSKADTGTMRLSAVNTYQGGTEVQGGTLILTGRLIGGGAVTVDDGATLDVAAGAATAIVITNDLTLGSAGALTLGFANVNSPTVPLVSVGNVILTDVVTVNIGGKVGVGQFPLIKYAGTNGGTGSFTLGTLPAGVSASISNNVTGQSLDLVVTSAPLSIITDISNGTNYAYAGTTYNLVVAAGGNPTLGYQWYFNNTPIPGATAANLSLPRITAANDGSYHLIVTNTSGSVSSSTNHLIVLPDSGYTAMAIATGPTAYWPLNESSGPTAIDYMGGHNANYSSGGVTYSVTGPVGASVITVNGSSGQVACPYLPDLNPSGPFTAEAWLNPASVTASLVCALSSAHAASPRAGWLIYESTAGWEFRTYNQNGTATAVDITGGTPTVGTWNHIAIAWDGSKGYVYVNGVLKNTSVATNFVANPDGAFTIGSRSDSSFYWPGSVGDVAFYNRVLTPQEIQTHAQNSPSLQITPSGRHVILSWVPSGGGSLLASPVVNGPYTNVPTATSPWTNTPAGNQFYRVGF